MSQRVRTLILWVLIILLLIGTYRLLTPGSRLSGPSGWILLVIAAVAVGFARFGTKGSRQGVRLYNEGILLLSNGRWTLALEKFETARPLLDRPWRASNTLYIGLCQMELWRLDAAEREFGEALDTRSLSKPLQSLLLPRQALVAALRGDLRGAIERGANAREADAEPALLVLLEGIIACRRGEWDQARSLLEDPVTHVLGGPLRGLRDALLVWSVEHTSRGRRYLDPVAVLGEASPDTLRESWPELVDYLLERSRAKA